MKKLILPLITILFLLFGLRGVLLVSIGQETTGVVTGREQVVDQNTDKMDHVYKVSYAFSARNGERYTGSYRKKAYNITRIPGNGSSVRVRYLAFAPRINSKDGEGVVLAWVFLAAGLLIPVVSFRRKRGKAATG